MDKIILPYRGKTPEIDPTVFVAPTAAVIGDVTIGAHSSVWFGAVVRGDFQPITIGENTNIQDNATIHVMRDVPVHIGSNVAQNIHGRLDEAFTPSAMLQILHEQCTNIFSFDNLHDILLAQQIISRELNQ